LGEAELAGWEEGAKYFVEVMGIQSKSMEAEETTKTVEKEQGIDGTAKENHT
jgi:hypothetical protein